MVIRLLASLCIVLVFAASANACSLDENQIALKAIARTINETELCTTIASGLFSDRVDCTYGAFDRGDAYVKITRAAPNNIVKFDVEMLARSSLLANKIGDNGYEHHKYAILLFLDLECVNSFWVYEYEPEFIRGVSFDIAKNLGNDNWQLFSDVDRLNSLSDRIRSWVIRALRAKI